jgi:hypothetical protein
MFGDFFFGIIFLLISGLQSTRDLNREHTTTVALLLGLVVTRESCSRLLES